ncbi:TPA_asm: maturation protein [ssRNA phage SRR5466727_5]|uniref:Maturation protein n=1 Tax=ssRNA phage SRR5466727_5 TaxID=2786434 RepID=A0A8S5L460_9VIRU|nr:maturation protein [ssRNA phage SRR5466727_5]DAD52457.1 TPA_asm: maturation protein [ssRNA phage SRR5466727_5]
MRLRHRNKIRASPSSHRWYSKPANVLTGSYDGEVTWTEFDSIEDVEVVGFKGKSRKGEVFVNPMTRHTSAGVVLPRSWTSEGKTGRHTGSQSFSPGNFTVTPALQDKIDHLEKLAITEAYAAVGKPTFATLTELVELRETLSFLASPVKAMLALTKRADSYVKRYNRWQASSKKRLESWEKLPAYKRSKIPKPTNGKAPSMQWGKFRVTDVSSMWLAYRYAVMPLIYSFQDIQKLIEEHASSTKPHRATARAKAAGNVGDEAYSTSSESLSGDTGYGALKYQQWVQADHTITCRAGVLYTPDWSLQTLAGVRLNRIPAALYEGIPLSFVSDWFHNGAEYYDALTAEFRALKILAAWVVTTIDYSFHTDYQISPAVGTIHTSVSGGDRSLVSINTGRYKTRRQASLSDVRLMLRTKLSAKRIVDGLALTHLLLDGAIKKGKT